MLTLLLYQRELLSYFIFYVCKLTFYDNLDKLPKSFNDKLANKKQESVQNKKRTIINNKENKKWNENKSLSSQMFTNLWLLFILFILVSFTKRFAKILFMAYF